MPGPFITGDDGQIGVLNGTRMANGVIEHPSSSQVEFAIYPVTNRIIIAPDSAVQAGFKMPDLYNYLPEFVRLMDVNLVERGNVPLFAWDSVPKWDESPFTWDEVIGPEPILKTTVRIWQLELEKTCQEISLLFNNKSAEKTPREFLPYLAAELGAPLPSASEAAQRSFLNSLAQTYRNKGTPLSFRRLIESLGFNLTLVERYQRILDGAFVTGPQIREVSSNLVEDEPVGTTEVDKGPHRWRFLNIPIQRGSIRLKVFATSTVNPIEVIDDSAGGWSDNFGGFINYDTGLAELILEQPPTLVGQDITGTYRFFVDEFPDPFNLRNTDKYRSSVVDFSITPKDASVGLTSEIIDRLLLYINLLKPAHVIFQQLDLLLLFSESVDPIETLQPYTMQFVDSVFGNLYLGAAWDAQNNGSIDPNPASPGQHRTGPEFLRKIPQDDVTRLPSEAPYVYPWKMNGKFTMPTSGNDFEADWFETLLTFTADVTNDVAVPTVTNFSIDFNGGTALGVGDRILIEPDLLLFDGDGSTTVFNGTIGPASLLPIDERVTTRLTFSIKGVLHTETAEGTGAFSNRSGFINTSNVAYTTGVVDVTFTIAPDNGTDNIKVTTRTIVGSGENSEITGFTDVGPGNYFDVTVSPALPVAPIIGGKMTVLDADSPRMNRLETGEHEEESLELKFGQIDFSPVPNGVATGPFTTTIVAAHLPIVGTSILRFVIAATTYEETATGTGAFTNTNGFLTASSIDYTTGAVSATFNTAPDSGAANLMVLTNISTTTDLGVY